jgi:hypothetical protein
MLFTMQVERIHTHKYAFIFSSFPRVFRFLFFFEFENHIFQYFHKNKKKFISFFTNNFYRYRKIIRKNGCFSKNEKE